MSRRIKLIIVDDEVRFLETLGKRLSMRDFDVTTATDGQTAIELARKQPYDLALVDLKMPGLTGEEVLGVLKEEHPDVEVIILTGHHSIDSAVRCTQAGSYRYLQKPCETEKLLSVLRDAYMNRVQRRLELDETKMRELLSTGLSESPLAVLRRLRELDGEKE